MWRFIVAGVLWGLSVVLIGLAFHIYEYMLPRLLDDSFWASFGRTLHDTFGVKAEKARRWSWIKNLALMAVPLLWLAGYLVLAYWRPEASAQRLRRRAERERKLAEDMSTRVQRMHQTQTFEKVQGREEARAIKQRAAALEAKARKLDGRR